MIVKFCRPGFDACIEADNVTSQLCENGRRDVRLCLDGVEVYRALILDTLVLHDGIEHPTYDRAYVMEGGRTVDTIRP